MSFREPSVLIGLLLLPLAAMAYAVMQRRKRADAARFGNPALLPGLATARPGWRRHLPPLLLLVALGALVVALARPQRTVAAPQRQATVMMVTDVSGSMRANDVEPDRLSAAVEAGHTLADKLPDELRLGLVSFSDYAEQTVPPTTERGPVKDALDRLVADGGTAMGDALRRGIEAVRTPVANRDGSGTRRLPGVIVLLSDGKNTSGNTRPLDVARQAKALHIPIYAIALGTPSGRIELTDPFSGTTQTIAVPPDPGDAEGDRDDHRRALLRDREGRRPEVDLREPRHAALLQAGEARGDGRVRRRRAGAAAARRRPQPRVVRPPPIAVSTSRSASPDSPTASTTPTPRA